MYESHFGISGPPFQLNPDPGFYFDSRGHHGVLAQLHRGLELGRGIVVLSGEVGAGKTTLMRSIVAELAEGEIVVAQIFSSQLDAAELVDAVLLAFGAPLEVTPGTTPIDRLRGFLERAARAGKRTLLLIDEAQNLPKTSFDLLLGVLDPGQGPTPLLQVWLIGQPELRAMLESGDLVGLKRHVVVACHLGPMSAAEVGAYIEHRLRRVGWTGTPAFEPGAFEAVYRWTEGVPRRINMLCNRLMLASYLTSIASISADMVATTASDLLSEIGEPVKLSAAARATEAEYAPVVVEEVAEAAEVEEAPDAALVSPAPETAAAVEMPEPEAFEAEAQPEVLEFADSGPISLLPIEVEQPPVVVRRPPPAEVPLPELLPESAFEPPPALARAVDLHPGGPLDSWVQEVDLLLDEAPPRVAPPTPAPPVDRRHAAPLLIVVAGYGDHVKAAALWRAIVDRTGAMSVRLVRVFQNTAFRLNRGLFPDMEARTAVVELDVVERSPSQMAADITERFSALLARDGAKAVIVIDGSDAALACCLAAQAAGIPVAHVNAGLRLREQPTARDLTCKLTDDAATVLYTPEMAHLEQLAQEGAERGRLACVGNLLVDAMQATLPSLGEAPGKRARLVVPEPYLGGRNGYALVLMSQPVNVGDRNALHQTLDVVGLAGRDLPLLWIMHDPVRDLFLKSRLDRGLSASSITVVSMQPYSVYLDILRSATCVITDSWNVQEEAATLGIPCVIAGMRGTRPAAIGQRFGHVVGLNKSAVTRAIWDCIFTGGRRPVVPPQWDGQTAARLVDHLYARVATAPMRATA